MEFRFTILLILITSITMPSYCLRCLSCNSIFDENCSSNPLKLMTELCEEGDDCVTFADNNSTIYRGCSSEMDENISKFKKCNTSDFCNNQKVCFPEANYIFCDENIENKNDEDDNYQLCKECDSVKGHDCRQNLSEVKCRKGDKNGCYHYEIGDEVKRGCVSHLSLDDQLLHDCEKGSNCRICDKDNCNSKATLQKCYTCNSADYKSCATLERDLPEKICNDYFDTCKVYVKPNATTHRGCSKEIDDIDIECLPQTLNCRECSENLCNGGIFPPNRLTCYHCEDFMPSDCSDSVKEDMIRPCEIFNFRDYCYVTMDKSNKTYRGCLSDKGFFSTSCQNDPNECTVCQTPNCNAKRILRPPTISCIKCDTSMDPKCLWGFSEGSKAPCSKNVLHYQEESCFTFQMSETTLIRGCTLDNNVCKFSDGCQICNTDACNKEKKALQYCIECSSEEDKKCFSEPQVLKNVSCDGNFTFEQRGCYTWIDESNEISRGCYANLTATRKFKCLNDHERCELCYQGNNCNILPKNSSSSNSISKILISILLYASLIFISIY